ncbi:hypothetical protein D3C87_908420 [compost metagenome]
MILDDDFERKVEAELARTAEWNRETLEAEITHLRQLLSEAEKREKEARAIDVDKIAKALTGHIAGTCCHKTGAVNDDPKCECRILAAAALSALQSEER